MTDSIFKPASTEEIKKRKEKWDNEIYPQIVKEWITKFKTRSDVVKENDLYNVNGDIIFLEPYPILHEFPVPIGKVNGHLITTSLKSLKNFPKEVNGCIVLNDTEITPEEIRKKCTGTYLIHYGTLKKNGI